MGRDGDVPARLVAMLNAFIALFPSNYGKNYELQTLKNLFLSRYTPVGYL